jgi:two-component system, cell cycle sensor histidine kinase and response regulator CckA
MPISSTKDRRPVPPRDETGQLAHELNNLLAVIGGHADAIEPSLPAEGPDRESIVAIQRAVVTAAAVVDRVRTLGGRPPAPVRGVDVQPVVDRTSGDAARRFGHRLSVTVHPSTHLWSASVPPTLVEQVLWHLLSQAVDVMPHGGTLTVRCMNVEIGGAAARPAERRERFVRVELSCATVFPAAGSTPIGDETARSPEVETLFDSLVQAGGRVATETDGTTMATWALLLPSDGVEPLPASVPIARAATILVVDADEARRSLMQALLQRQGYAAHASSSVDDAARALEARRVDLLVADAAMTGLAGDAAALARTHAVKVLRIEPRDQSAPASDPTPGHALRAPFSADQLMAGVDAALGAPATEVARPRVLAYRDAVAVHSEEIA